MGQCTLFFHALVDVQYPISLLVIRVCFLHKIVNGLDSDVTGRTRRRESDLLHRFCFKCGCERCASESSSFERALQSLEATERAEAGASHRLAEVCTGGNLSSQLPDPRM